MGRDTFHYTRYLKAPSSLAFNTSREGSFTTSLGNLFHYLTTLTEKNFFLISNLNVPSHSLMSSPIVLSVPLLTLGASSSLRRVPQDIMISMHSQVRGTVKVHELLQADKML